MRTHDPSDTGIYGESRTPERAVTASRVAAGLLPAWVNEPAEDAEQEAPAKQKADALLTVDGVAAYLRVSTKTVRRQIAAGNISAIRIGRSIRVNPEELERLASPKDSQVINNA